MCHGPAALVQAVDASGKSIFAGKRFTGFSNVEEEQVKMVDAIPFSLEDKISGLGGKYEKAAEPWGVRSFSLHLSSERAMLTIRCLLQVHVVVDGHLVTGQNPASAKSIAEKIAELLK